MMTPSQINTQRFNTVAKGGYRTVEVDAFLQKIYQHYSRLYSDNNELHERAENMANMVAEYEKSKSAIAQALIWAQAKADESEQEAKKLASSIIAEASQEAESLLVKKKAEAEAVYAERTNEAEERLKAAQENFEKVKAEAESFSEKYINDVNKKAKEIIADATEKASSIVASAYADAKAAREKADEIISKTNKELNEYKAEIAKLKKELSDFISKAQNAVDVISVEEDFIVENSKESVTPELDIKEPEIKEFTYSSELLEKIDEVHSVSVDEKTEEVISEKAEDKLPPIDLISQQGADVDSAKAEIPDVNSYISKIFDSVANEKKEKAAKFSIDYKSNLDDLISEVLEGDNFEAESVPEDIEDDSDMKEYHIEDKSFDDEELFGEDEVLFDDDEIFGGEEEFE